MCVEIFCGKAKLSKFLRRKGFQVFSVDHRAPKGVPVLLIDINSPSQKQVLEELLRRDAIIYVHFAPPCGTCSAARNIRLSKHQHGPPPLRSMRRPMGLFNLKGVQKLRVEAANRLYQWTVDMIIQLDARNVDWSIENPASSLLWITDPFLMLRFHVSRIFAVSFHTCMYMADRKKTTAIWASFPEITDLRRTCDGTHQHLQWGLTQSGTGFATAEECAYNDNLAAAWAEVFWCRAQTRNIVPEPQTFDEVTAEQMLQIQITNKALVGLLPRGRLINPMIPDFAKPQLFCISKHQILQTMQVGARVPDMPDLPSGTRLLSHVLELKKGDVDKAHVVGVQPDKKDMEELLRTPVKDAHGRCNFAMLAIPRGPDEFLACAIKLVHPVLQRLRIGEALEHSIQINNDGLELRKRRLNNFIKAVETARMCEAEDSDLHDNMDSELRKVLKGKRTILFHKLLLDVQYPDAKVASELGCGFPLYGWLPMSSVFPKLVRPPSLHAEALQQMSVSFSKRSLASIKSSGDIELDLQLWQATMDEVQAGYLEGPHDVESLPRGAIVSPRFGLQQRNKLRPIDNMTASGINNAVGLGEKLRVDGVDEAVAMIKAWMAVTGPGLILKGKTYDLRKAYRQIAVRPDARHAAWIGVWSPSDGRAKVFSMSSMPFGATASVGAFLRLSVAIKTLGIMLYHFVWTSYYDDFIVVCRDQDCESTDKMVRNYFSLLGWELSHDEAKDKGFAAVFGALGVEFDLRYTHSGKLFVGNTSNRKTELSEQINNILSADRLSSREAVSLRSRLLFAESQIFGRMAKQALKTIGNVGLSDKDVVGLNEQLVSSLKWMRDRVLNAPPRCVEVMDRSTFFLFLDGACTEKAPGVSWSGTSVGGVLCDSQGQRLQYFGEVLDESITGLWGARERKQLIFEAEILPYSIALRLWGSLLKGACVFVFIDNEAAKFSWISGTADSAIVSSMLKLGLEMECDINLAPYFCRVPSYSNLGDDPSRGKFDELNAAGAIRRMVDRASLFELAGG